MADRPANLLCLRLDWDRTALNMPTRWLPFHRLDVSPEPGWPTGRKGLALASAWAQLAGKDTDGLLLLDGDVAIDPADLQAMYAAINSDRLAVWTPLIRLWPISTKRDRWIWSHMTAHPTERGQDDLGDTDPSYRFSFGFTYLPRRLVDAAAGAGLKQWRYPHCDEKMHQLAARLRVPVRIVRGCTPKHLNY